MLSFRTLCLPLLGAALLTQPALAQTKPTTPKPAHKPAPRMVPNTSAAARGTNGKGNNGYAAPGEPINVQDNGKNTPSYDGPAPKAASRTKTTLATPK